MVFGKKNIAGLAFQAKSPLLPSEAAQPALRLLMLRPSALLQCFAPMLRPKAPRPNVSHATPLRPNGPAVGRRGERTVRRTGPAVEGSGPAVGRQWAGSSAAGGDELEKTSFSRQ